MFMKWIAAVIGGSLFLGICCISCVEYTPKPRGYVVLNLRRHSINRLISVTCLLILMFSQTAVIEVPDQKKGVTGLNISYPELEAKLYCSYLPITPASLVTVETESRSFVARLIKSENRISEKAYSNPAANVYGSLFLLDGESASPIQFLLTDSVSNFFRGPCILTVNPMRIH